MGQGDDTYERPLIEPDSPMTGGFQTGKFDATPRPSTGRAAARWALALAVLWIGGLGSLVAIPLAALALASGEIGGADRRFALAALTLGALGLVASVGVFLTAG